MEKPLRKGNITITGTSQSARLPHSLNPDNIRIDDRDTEELQKLAEEIASYLLYFDLQNQSSGESWQSFFAQGTPVSQPHYTLFNAFLLIFKNAQEHLNSRTKTLLQFYYEDVLQLKKKQPVPDRMNAVFELQKRQTEFLANAGLECKAGKDENGSVRLYELVKDIVLTKAQVHQLHTVHVGRTDNVRLYAKSLNNNGNHRLVFNEGQPIEIFGENQLIRNDFGDIKDLEPRTMQDATHGFAVASPELILREGERSIDLTLKLTKVGETMASKELENVFTLWFSGEKGWMGPVAFDIHVFNYFLTGDSESFQIRVSCTLPLDFPPIVPLPAGQNNGIQSQWPAMQLLINQSKGVPRDVWNWRIEGFEIETRVEGLQELTLHNDRATINRHKVFPPFGIQPQIGTSLYICSTEAFEKRLTSLSINIDWFDPPEDLSTYYANYSTSPPISNHSFRGSVELLYSKTWHELSTSSSAIDVDIYRDQSEEKLYRFRIYEGDEIILNSEQGYESLEELNRIIDLVFEMGIDAQNYEMRTTDTAIPKYFFNLVIDPNVPILVRSQEYWETEALRLEELNRVIDTLQHESSIHALYKENASERVQIRAKNSIARSQFDGLDRSRAPRIAEATPYTSDSHYGFIRLILNGPNQSGFTAYGHKQYPALLQTFFINNSKTSDTIQNADVLKEPLTPEIKKLSLSYTSSDTIDFAETAHDSVQTQRHEFFHVTSFGYAKKNESSSIRFLPEADSEGYLYLGIIDLHPPQTLSLLLQFEEGSAHPDFPISPTDIQWSRLVGNQWIPLEETHVISDATKGFQQSGILQLDLLDDMTSAHTLMPSGLHWIRASLASGTPGVCTLIDVRSQAAELRLKQETASRINLNAPLEAGTLEKLRLPITEIRSVTQPYASFGGKTEEEDLPFYARASERLRHKDRAVSKWDFERLVLEQFPSVFMCFCLNATRENEENRPGWLTMIILPDIRNQNAINKLQPKAQGHLLNDIHSFLKKRMSPYAQLLVQNPVYEEVLTDFQVSFVESTDKGYYNRKLNEDLVAFISPWLRSDLRELQVGTEIHRSTILKFIEDREYVDFVTHFRLYHIKKKIKHIGKGIGSMHLGNEGDDDENVFVISMEETDLIQAKHPNIVLTSTEQHHITVIDKTTANCAGGNPGIGQIMVGVNFEIT